MDINVDPIKPVGPAVRTAWTASEALPTMGPMANAIYPNGPLGHIQGSTFPAGQARVTNATPTGQYGVWGFGARAQ